MYVGISGVSEALIITRIAFSQIPFSCISLHSEKLNQIEPMKNLLTGNPNISAVSWES